MKNITKVEMYVQDSTNKESFLCIHEAKSWSRADIPKLGELVVLDDAFALDGFEYKKRTVYKIIEVRNDYIEGVLLLFLALF